MAFRRALAPGSQSKRLSMEQALAEFLRHLGLEKNASAHTVKSYREDLTQAIEFFRTKLGTQTPPPEQLTTRLLRAHLPCLHEQGYPPTTTPPPLAAAPPSSPF